MAAAMFFPSRANVANSYAGCPNVPVSRPTVRTKKSGSNANATVKPKLSSNDKPTITPTTETPPRPPYEQLDAMNPGLYPIRTRSVGSALVFERDPTASADPHPDDIIIVTVKLSRKERRNSYDDPLPDRPPPRSFLRRMSTRILTQGDSETYKAVKMPRSEYLANFRHDREGNYAGTEPQREWVEEEIVERYKRFQDLPLQRTGNGSGW